MEHEQKVQAAKVKKQDQVLAGRHNSLSDL